MISEGACLADHTRTMIGPLSAGNRMLDLISAEIGENRSDDR
jgi:hypothetical protein